MTTLKHITTLVMAPIIAGAVCTTIPVYADASTTSNNICTVKAVGSKDTVGNPDSRFITSGNNTVSAVVTVSGTSGCEQSVTMASWEAPDASKGQPYSEQQLYKSTTETFTVGTHDISVTAPDCYFQIDLVTGTSPTGPNGSPVYGSDRMLGSLHGGTQTCVQTPVTPVTPVTTVTPVTPQTPAPVQPTALPNTGSGSMPLYLGLAATILGTVYSYTRRVRSSAL